VVLGRTPSSPRPGPPSRRLDFRGGGTEPHVLCAGVRGTPDREHMVVHGLGSTWQLGTLSPYSPADNTTPTS
jgi:hypothetical protein